MSGLQNVRVRLCFPRDGFHAIIILSPACYFFFFSHFMIYSNVCPRTFRERFIAHLLWQSVCYYCARAAALDVYFCLLSCHCFFFTSLHFGRCYCNRRAFFFYFSFEKVKSKKPSRHRRNLDTCGIVTRNRILTYTHISKPGTG